MGSEMCIRDSIGPHRQAAIQTPESHVPHSRTPHAWRCDWPSFGGELTSRQCLTDDTGGGELALGLRHNHPPVDYTRIGNRSCQLAQGVTDVCDISINTYSEQGLIRAIGVLEEHAGMNSGEFLVRFNNGQIDSFMGNVWSQLLGELEELRARRSAGDEELVARVTAIAATVQS